MKCAMRASAVVLMLAAYGFATPPAVADVATFHLTGFNVSGYSGPYGFVTIDRTATDTATITFAADTSADGTTYLFMDGGAAAVNVNASSWGISGIGGTPYIGTAVLSDGGGSTLDGWGSFNQTVNNHDGAANVLTSVYFTLTNKSGTWGTAQQVLAPNGPGEMGKLAAAHVVPLVNGEVQGNFTGFAAGFGDWPGGGGGGGPVPEASTWALLGFGGLPLALAALRARKRR